MNMTQKKVHPVLFEVAEQLAELYFARSAGFGPRIKDLYKFGELVNYLVDEVASLRTLEKNAEKEDFSILLGRSLLHWEGSFDLLIPEFPQESLQEIFDSGIGLEAEVVECEVAWWQLNEASFKCFKAASLATSCVAMMLHWPLGASKPLLRVVLPYISKADEGLYISYLDLLGCTMVAEKVLDDLALTCDLSK